MCTYHGHPSTLRLTYGRTLYIPFEREEAWGKFSIILLEVRLRVDSYAVNSPEHPP
jgi:hypothetical protein